MGDDPQQQQPQPRRKASTKLAAETMDPPTNVVITAATRSVSDDEDQLLDRQKQIITMKLLRALRLLSVVLAMVMTLAALAYIIFFKAMFLAGPTTMKYGMYIIVIIAVSFLFVLIMCILWDLWPMNILVMIMFFVFLGWALSFIFYTTIDLFTPDSPINL